MELAAWIDIIGVLFLITTALLCYREGVLWPIFLLLGSLVAHLLATSPEFQHKVRTAFPALERAMPLSQTVPVIIFVITIFGSHHLARFISSKLETSSIRFVGSANRFLGAIVGMFVACTLLAWAGKFAIYNFPELAPHVEASTVVAWCIEQEERYDLQKKLVAIFHTEAEKIKDLVSQR
ncbi:MAG TPA: CvpA family protein [Candidatus Bathyarchaeota archaeon]|nr:CvpA family protein [Candidatus Bathyarchaeota archaeon]